MVLQGVSSGDDLFNEYIDIRREVFCVEQKIAENEEFIASEEAESLHFVWLVGENNCVGCVRLRDHKWCVKLERVAVRKNWRCKGQGCWMVRAAVLEALRLFPSKLIVAHAQTYTISFYAKLGFIPVSEEFLDEVNILHKTIVIPPFASKRSGLVSIPSQLTPPDDFIKGSCDDPETQRNIQNLLDREDEEVYIATLHYLLDISKIGRFLLAALMSYAYSMAKETYGEAVNNEELLIDTAWERLNVGHYSEVDEEWRKFYAIISLCKATRIFKSNKDIREALCVADKGLLMGRSNKDVGLVECAEKLAEMLRHSRTDKERQNLKLSMINAPSTAPPPLPNSQHIRVGSLSDLEDIILTCGEAEEPLIVRGCSGLLKILSKEWTFDYLIEILRDRTVPLELGSSYSDSDWTQVLQPCARLFEHIINMESLIANGSIEELATMKPYYLAQHRLLEQVTSLRKDVSVPALIETDTPSSVDVNVWLGGRHTVSPLHTDPRHNAFVQVIGSKFFRLISPLHTDHVYPIEGMLSNTSQVNIANPDVQKFPLFTSAVCWDGIVEAGDLLYIPRKWWHYVRSLEPSASLSFWFDKEGDTL